MGATVRDFRCLEATPKRPDEQIVGHLENARDSLAAAKQVAYENNAGDFYTWANSRSSEIDFMLDEMVAKGDTRV